MGNPTHFSLEVTKRAHELLRNLYDRLDNESGGTQYPPKATFLLSVSMPMVIFPIERILNGKDHTDDARLNEGLADAVKRAIDPEAEVREAGFFTGSWAYAELQKGPEFPNLAEVGLPDNVAADLDLPKALQDAEKLPAREFFKILRNALAHGGVLYLDKHGRSCSGAPVSRFITHQNFRVLE